MSSIDPWEETNDRYLSSALHWLRLRLQRLAEHAAGPAATAGYGRSAMARGDSSGGSGGAAGNSTWFPCQFESITDDELASAESAMLALEATDPPPALIALSHAFGFSRFERQLLLLCVAMELDPSLTGSCARAQQDERLVYPTFALAFTLFAEPSWDVMSRERPLLHWQFISVEKSALEPLTTSALRADERSVHYVKGLNDLDSRLAALVSPLFAEDNATLSATQEACAALIARSLEAPEDAAAPRVVGLVGTDAVSKELVACGVARRLGRRVHQLPIECLPKDFVELEMLARLWERESRLLPLALYFDLHDSAVAGSQDGAGPAPALAPLRQFLGRTRAPTFLSVREPLSRLGAPVRSFQIDKPTQEEQQAAWESALSPQANEQQELLSSHFNLNLTTIRRIAQSWNELSVPKDAVGSARSPHDDAAWRACLDEVCPALDQVAERMRVKASWDDLMLPEESLDLLRQIALQARHRSRVYGSWGFGAKLSRGLGINALFAGESGTGKTMAAEVLANDLKLNLYRIDLSGVMSKYIGETEKNLRRLFDAAESGGALLFFDEADALFGKRSEVKDSHDRYANIEINYLLQRIESYNGVAILATNMRSALDPAFLRRLRFIVSFPFPSARERERIWAHSFPARTPTSDLDFGRLARLNLSGGSITNVALNAAFRAVALGSAVTMGIVLDAAREEFRKLERPINETEFRTSEFRDAVSTSRRSSSS